jgi:hypothetical protein
MTYQVTTQHGEFDTLHYVVRVDDDNPDDWTVIRTWSARKFPHDAFDLACRSAREMNRLSQLDDIEA